MRVCIRVYVSTLYLMWISEISIIAMIFWWIIPGQHLIWISLCPDTIWQRFIFRFRMAAALICHSDLKSSSSFWYLIQKEQLFHTWNLIQKRTTLCRKKNYCMEKNYFLIHEISYQKELLYIQSRNIAWRRTTFSYMKSHTKIRISPPQWPSSQIAMGPQRFTGQVPLQDHEIFSKNT